MSSRISYRLIIGLCLLMQGTAFADAPPASLANNNASPKIKPVAVIHFNDHTAMSNEHSLMIHSMVKEAESNFHLPVQEYEMAQEDGLAAQVEKIAEDDIGLIIIIEPHNIESLMKIPSLYPDVNFSIIGVTVPLYFANVRSMQFRESEGAFMMGALAAINSKNNSVAFISVDDNAATRTLAYAFLQGSKYANPEIRVQRQLGTRPPNGVSIPATSILPDSDADVVFVLDEILLEPILYSARADKRRIISYDHDLTAAYPGLVLTSLLKHYDLAIYHTLRSYTRNEWRSGSQTLGIGNGFMDYALNNSNKALLPKESIEQIEMIKDFVSQGIIQINALVQ